MDDCCGTPAYMAPEVIKIGNYIQRKAKLQRSAKKENV
jgi:serine/threonine protein kinase